MLLSSKGQEHLLQFYDQLSEAERDSLIHEILNTDFSYVTRFSEKDTPPCRGEIAPLHAMRIEEIRSREEALRAEGLEALRAGQIAAVLLAGGMGTRLGISGPKGCFDIGLTRPVYIFQRLIENLMIRVRECGRFIRLFIMTSDVNDRETQDFFRAHDYFGYDPSFIYFFRQDMAPAVSEDGHILLKSRSSMASSPNGNGGWFLSLQRAGLMDVIEKDGIRFLNVFAVDNVLQSICDPVFIGAVLKSGCASGSKVVKKTSPEEKVGVMCLEDGRPSVIEYYEMTDEMRYRTDAEGRRVYDYGVILNYLFRVPDLMRASGMKLPLHFANKKIPFVDSEGRLVTPDQPNGWKFEYFIFDILKALDSCLPFEVEREREFAPVKNASGQDSVETARALLIKNGIEL